MISHSDIAQIAEALASLARGGSASAAAHALREVADRIDPPQKALELSNTPAKFDLSPAREVFDHWVSATGRDSSRCKFNPARRDRIVARLREGYSVDDLKAAINGCMASPWHQGANENGRSYDDLELILRNGEHVERFRGYVEAKERTENDPELQALENW